MMNMMEFIWETVKRPGNGEEMVYTDADIEGLWELGFVDTERFPKAKWFGAVAPYKKPDGAYRFKKEEFLSLDAYRYQGEIKIPLNPLRINEGKYTDEGLQELVDLSIAPSTGYAKSELHQKVEGLKKKYRQTDGLILIKMSAKQEIRQWLEECPSPLRRLELLFADFLGQQGFREESVQQLQVQSRVATPEEQEKIAISTFSMLPSSVVEQKAADFKKMAKARPPEDQPPEGPPLKKIKRSRKGTRG